MTGKSPVKIHDEIFFKKITKPTLIFKDRAGNTLWGKYIKSRNRIQVFGRNRQKRLLDEEGVAYLMELAGLYDDIYQPLSEKGRRMVDYASEHQEEIHRDDRNPKQRRRNR